MRRLLALTMCVASFTAVAQINYPYNPDEDASGQIENNDLLGFLTVYGNTLLQVNQPSLVRITRDGQSKGAPAVFDE